jgi:glycosyltransferase involved in cell wall biosynthesis
MPLGLSLERSSGRKKGSSSPSITWAARWEHDKNPEDLLRALRILTKTTLDFRLNVVGECFRDVPEVFKDTKSEFSSHIDHWGYQRTREDYLNVLRQSDIVLSTANHEFFGIAVL